MARLSGRRGRSFFLLAVVWACLLLVLGAFAAPARADSLWVLSSNSGSGDWFNTNNWSSNQVPTSSTNAVIDDGGTALIASTTASAKALTIGQTAAYSTNTLSLTGGLLTVTSNLILGDQTNAYGQATISGGALIAQGGATLGNYGTGLVNIVGGGSVTNGYGGPIYLGYSTNGAGTMNVSGAGSTWRSNAQWLDFAVGYSGNGTLNITDGGTVTTAGQFASVGYGTNSVGTVNISGTNSSWTVPGDGHSAPVIGYYGTGTVTVSGTGASFAASDGLTIGNYGNGTLNIMNGASVSNGGATLGFFSGGTGTVNVSGPGSSWTITGSMSFGGNYYSSGTGGLAVLNITQGGKVLANGVGGWDSLSVAYGTPGYGIINVIGPGSALILTGETLVIASGELHIRDGGAVTSGAPEQPYGTDEVSGGTLVEVSGTGATWTCRSSLHIGGTGTVLTVGVGGTVQAASIGISVGSTLNLQGGQINAHPMWINSATIGGWGTLGALGDNLDIEVSGTLSASDTNHPLVLARDMIFISGITVTKTGPGTLVIAGTQSHPTGGDSFFFVNAGQTQMNSDAGGPPGGTPYLSVQTSNAGGSPTLLAFGVTQHLHALTVGTNTTASLDTNGQRIIVTDGLTMQGASSNIPAGTLNLHDNSLIVHNGNLLTVRAAIKAGWDGGAWDRPGIVTDLSSSNASVGAGKVKALGYALGSDANLTITSLNGEALAPGDVVVKYTYAGDANLDGSVDGLDIALWAVNFTGALNLDPTADPAKTWTQGDWNFDGSVDGLDAAIWAANFTGALGGGGLGGEQWPSGQVAEWPSPAAVATLEGTGPTVAPEPASLALLGLGGMMLVARGRRRRARAA